MKTKIFSNIFLWGWVLLCIAGIFIHSQSLIDSYIIPKWLAVISLAFTLCVWCSVRRIFKKPIELNLQIMGICLLILGSVQAVYGLLQYFSLYSSHSIYKVTGTFDNPAGFASCLCFCLPFVAFLISQRNKYIGFAGWIMGGLIVTAVFLSYSRSGIVSIVTICAIVSFERLNCSAWYKYLMIILVSGLLIVPSYLIKRDSADGRLLIWQCGLEMVKDAPWWGHGIRSFEAHYMDYQAQYFKEHGLQNRNAMLADNVKQPFNEYLRILINWGGIGLLLFLSVVGLLIYCYKRNPTTEKHIALYALISVGVFSGFSYPFSYPFTWIVTCLIVLMLVSDCQKQIRIPLWCRNIVYIVVVVGAFLGINWARERFRLEHNWHKAFALALCNSYDEALPYYVSMLHQFYDNPYFLYNYAAVLLENRQYERSLQIALQCRKYWADYDLELMIGEIYQQLNKPKLAEKYYNSASMMCPSRFLPLYKLFHLYKTNGEKERSLAMAEAVISKPMKIKTTTIRMMKREMEREIQKMNMSIKLE
ncbi:O-antigen ligase family protein [Bacteroides thetaiotaomicron]|jgi:O-antigen polymerase|uniref:O-antigen ligase family protein n=1 Tax=Bacteroides thetaiotaomicron TaxID=818 RepID=UPI0006DD3853|nr:O-antigen ligase family protein [Bacteroides thetaiotaomicron]